MLARIELSEKLKAAMVIASFFCVVLVDDFLSLLPQAASTRANTTATTGKRRALYFPMERCFRMDASLLGGIRSPRPLWPRRRRSHSCLDGGASIQPRRRSA